MRVSDQARALYVHSLSFVLLASRVHGCALLSAVGRASHGSSSHAAMRVAQRRDDTRTRVYSGATQQKDEPNEAEQRDK